MSEGLKPGELFGIIDRVIERRETYLTIAEKYGTPHYLVDAPALNAQVSRFNSAFEGAGRPVHTHYAFKANPTLQVVTLIRDAGVAADVSSGIELELALALGFERIVFSGPAKTDDELRLASENADRVTVHIDSFRDLANLDRVARSVGAVVRAGIRLNTTAHGLWTKFGIPLSALPDFLDAAEKTAHVVLEGVQFHLSWNRDASRYLETLALLGPILKAHAPRTKNGWRFVDIGGGFYPEDDEAVYPWMTVENRARALVEGLAEGPPDDWDLSYLLQRVTPIEQMASAIIEALKSHLDTSGALELWVEPGRYLANQSVHLLLGVRDVKGEALAITDGGTNLLGWERLESEHCPLINLSRPSREQIRINVYGSLCTPHDIWGYTCYASHLAPGDILMLSAQGSYVQTLAQRFIKPICQTLLMDANGVVTRVEPAETLADRYPSLAPKGLRI